MMKMCICKLSSNIKNLSYHQKCTTKALVLHVNQFENTRRMMQQHALKLSVCLRELAVEGISFTASPSKIRSILL